MQRLSLPSAVRRLVSMAHLQTLLKLGFGSISYLQGFWTDFTRNTYTSRACNFFIGGRGVENTQSPKNKSPFLILDTCNTKIWENVKKVSREDQKIMNHWSVSTVTTLIPLYRVVIIITRFFAYEAFGLIFANIFFKPESSGKSLEYCTYIYVRILA